MLSGALRALGKRALAYQLPADRALPAGLGTVLRQVAPRHRPEQAAAAASLFLASASSLLLQRRSVVNTRVSAPCLQHGFQLPWLGHQHRRFVPRPCP
jgi:hypothetical protein